MRHNNLWDVRPSNLILLFLIILTVSSCTSRSSDPVAAPAETLSAAETIARADKLYAQRADLTQVRETIALLRRGRTSEFQNYDIAWRLSRADYHLGAHTKDETERDNAYREGVEIGDAAVKLQAGKPEGHFWLGANMGGRAQVSMMSGAADAPDIRREMEAVIKLDEKFEYGSAYMVLGQVDLELPRLMGGDAEAAVKNLEKGLQFGPENALLRLRLAQGYLATGRNDDARKQLDTLINMKPHPDYVPEHNEAVGEAKKLLATKF